MHNASLYNLLLAVWIDYLSMEDSYVDSGSNRVHVK